MAATTNPVLCRTAGHVIHREELLTHIPFQNFEAFAQNYQASIDGALRSHVLCREPMWTEHIAVGSKPFVDRLAPQVRNRMQVEIIPEQYPDIEVVDRNEPPVWTVREQRTPYG